MRTLQVTISEQDFARLTFPSENVTYEALVRKIKKELALAALRRAQQIAVSNGLASMSQVAINAEIKAARHAKRSH